MNNDIVQGKRKQMREQEFKPWGTLAAPGMFIFCMLVLFTTGCNSVLPAAVKAISGSPVTQPAPGIAPSGQSNKSQSQVDCTAVRDAFTDFGPALAGMVNLTPDTNYDAFTESSSPAYLDFAKIRADLTALATIPDPTDPVELIYGKPSESIAYFRQMTAVAESDVKSKGSSFSDGTATGQKLIGIDTPWFQKLSAFSVGMGISCAS